MAAIHDSGGEKQPGRWRDRLRRARLVLIVVGVVLLNVLPIKMPQWSPSGEGLARFGLAGAFAIGFLFAAALCPVSAALFFSSLINSNGNVFASLLYGVGTGLPVLVFSFVLAFCAGKISQVYKATAAFEKGARLLTAVIFISIGVYYLWQIVV